MKSAIYGAGAMGTILGAYISKANYQIDLISHNKMHIDSLKKNGAKIIGKIEFIQKVNALTVEEMNSKYDIILLMTKQTNNYEITKSLIPYLKDDGVICTMQNGLPEESVAKVIGKDRVIGCTMSWGATFHGQGVCELTSAARSNTLTFSIGKYGNNDDFHFNYIVKLLETMGDVKVEENFIGARWAKLMINAAFSGISVVTNQTFGEIAKNRKTRRIALNIIKEGIEVAKVAKIKVEPLQGKDIVKLLDYNSCLKRQISLMIIPIAMRKHRNIKSSMLRDLANNRRTEVHAINGVISEYGKNYQVNTPFNDKIIACVKEIETKQRISTIKNLDYFK